MLTCLAKLAAAAGTADLTRALTPWVDDGTLRALAIWHVDAERSLLRPLMARGLPERSLLHAGPRTPESPLWSCVEAGREAAFEPLPPELAAIGVPRWTLLPLQAGDSRVGVVLCGSDADLSADLRALFEHLGAIVQRVVHADRQRLRAELFDQAVPLLDDGLIVATPDGVVLAYNPALQRMTGWSIDEIRQHGWTNLVYPDPMVRAEIQRGIAALTLGRPSEGIVRTLRRRDGTDLRAAIWSRLVPDPAGGAPAMLGVLRDVTTEEAARKRAVREESESRLGRLAGGIAHEFNNLLCAMMGHAELVALTPGLPASAAAHAETVVQGAQRGAHLSGQLLAFSGTANVRTRPTDLAAVVRQAVELWRPRLPAGVHVDLRIEPVAPVEADANQVLQVLVNLLANAGDAIGATGRLRVELTSVPASTSVRYRAPTAPPPDVPMARVRIADSGPGFSADALSHLFEPFYSGKDNGHGIGLAAARGIVAAHGGAFDVGRAEGAVVDVYLPSSRRPELALPDLVRGAEAHGERVWVVDDQPQVLEFTQISLEAHGYEVRVFDTVEGVLDAARDSTSPPDVLVLDVVMPAGGGPAAWHGLHALGIDAAVVWISGHTPDALSLPDAPGVFLQKPFTGRDLAAVIRRLLDTASPEPKLA
jgi:PAS domain S-box-containing protein